MNLVEEKYWKRVQRFLPVLQIVPFVRMIAVCNNLAFGKVDENSDIDLFVVAKTGHLFFVRTFVTLLLQVMGVRRHGKKISGRFCLSFFVDEESADLSEIALKNDVYLAFWVKNVVPIIDDGFADKFLEKNRWILAYFEENEKFSLRRDIILVKGFWGNFWQKFFGFVFDGKLGDFFEKKLMKWQLKRARAKSAPADEKANLQITEHILKFHNIDRRREYGLLWKNRFGQSKISSEKFRKIIL